MRSYVSLILFPTAIFFVFWQAGMQYEQIFLTLAIGLFILVILTALIEFSNSQRLISIFWYFLLVLSYMADQLYGSILLILGTIFGIYITLLALSELFQETGITPLVIFKVFIGAMNKPQTVSPPPKGVAEEEEKVYGPSMITIEPDTAAVMFKGSKQTRILGPNEFTSAPAEYVKRRYNLRPLHQRYEFQRVITQDLIATHIIIAATYGLNVDPEARIGERSLNSQEIDAIKRLNSWASNWEEELKSVTEKNVRRAVGEMLLSDATDVSSHGLLWKEIHEKLQSDIKAWGIKIYALNIVSLKPHKNITQAREDKWLIDTRTETLIRNEEARGEAWRRALAKLTEACIIARDQEIPEEVIYRELSRRMFEQAAIDPATRKRLRLELGDASADLRSGDPQQQ